MLGFTCICKLSFWRAPFHRWLSCILSCWKLYFNWFISKLFISLSSHAHIGLVCLIIPVFAFKFYLVSWITITSVSFLDSLSYGTARASVLWDLESFSINITLVICAESSSVPAPFPIPSSLWNLLLYTKLKVVCERNFPSVGINKAP